MKTLQSSTFRAAAFWAGLIGIAILTAPAAKAFTFNDGADKRDDTSMFNDPVNRAKSGLNADSGNKTSDQRVKSGVYFGGGQSQSFEDRNNSDRYFNPNNLLGR